MQTKNQQFKSIFSIQSLILFVVFSLAISIFTPSAKAEFISTPDSGALSAENEVISVLPTSSATYIGGSFGVVAPSSTFSNGGGFPFVTATGLKASAYPVVTGGTNPLIEATISDRAGGWYIAGIFTTVGGLSRGGLAHILADGSVDPSFNPGTGAEYNALALSSNGATLYVGGIFSTIGGQLRNNIAALSTSTGLATSFNPNSSSTVFGLALTGDDSTLYVGGRFTSSIGGQARNRLAALSTSTGLATSFNPNSSGPVYTVVLSPDESILYAGGEFTGSFGGQTRNYVGAVSTSTGLATSFNPNANSYVHEIVVSPDGNTVYIGGIFGTIGGLTQEGLVAFNANGTKKSSFAPVFSSAAEVYALAVSSDGSLLYVAGRFTTAGGQNHLNFAILNTSDGSVTSFDDGFNSYLKSVALSSDGSSFYVGGFFDRTFTGTGAVYRNSLAALSTDGTSVLSFNPNFGSADLRAITASPDGTRLYVGGYFNVVGGITVKDAVALNVSDGTLVTAFNLMADQPVYAFEFSPDGSIVYMSGQFTTIGGQTRNYIAAFNTADGSIVSSFDPNADNYVQVMKISSDGSTLYVGGDFQNIGGQARNRIAAISTSTGLATAFNPNANNKVRGFALSSDQSTLYVSGTFTNIGGQGRNRIAALSTSTGLATAFNPNANALVRNILLNSDESKIYATGQFITIGGQSRTGLASLNTSDGTANSLNQTGIDAGVILGISTDRSKLFATNGYERVSTSIFSVFSEQPVIPTVTSSAASGISTTDATLNGAITVTGFENSTVRGFEWGPTISYGTTISSSGSFGVASFTGILSSLTCGTSYNFRAYATNTAGTGYGSNQTFTTSACPSSGGGGGGGGGGPAPAPVPTPSPVPTPVPTPDPNVPVPPVVVNGAHPNGTLILSGQTIYLIKNNQRFGFSDPQEFKSYGYRFDQAVPANAMDLTLPENSQTVKAIEGTVVKNKVDGRTIYMVGKNGTKRGFVSGEVFLGLGYKFTNLPHIDMTDYIKAENVTSSTAAHPEGALVLEGKTVWWILDGKKNGFESKTVFDTYGFGFSQIVPANAADIALTEGQTVRLRDGTLVNDNGTVYIISDGKKIAFQSAEGFTGLGYKFSNVINYSLNSYEAGASIP